MSGQRGPLEGLAVVVTRAEHQAPELVSRLEAQGATVIAFPVIKIVDPADHGAALRSALDRIATYDWVVFTSTNAVERVAPRLRTADVAVAAIGMGTGQALLGWNIRPALVPESYVAESLLEEFPEGDGRVLFPRAAVGRDVLPEGLRAKGWEVDVVVAYETVPATPSDGSLRAVADADAITFTSASTVRNFVRVAGVDHVPKMVACIGPITAEAAANAGIAVDVVAEEHTLHGVVGSLTKVFGASS